MGIVFNPEIYSILFSAISTFLHDIIPKLETGGLFCPESPEKNDLDWAETGGKHGVPLEEGLLRSLENIDLRPNMSVSRDIVLGTVIGVNGWSHPLPPPCIGEKKLFTEFCSSGLEVKLGPALEGNFLCISSSFVKFKLFSLSVSKFFWRVNIICLSLSSLPVECKANSSVRCFSNSDLQTSNSFFVLLYSDSKEAYFDCKFEKSSLIFCFSKSFLFRSVFTSVSFLLLSWACINCFCRRFTSATFPWTWVFRFELPFPIAPWLREASMSGLEV